MFSNCNKMSKCILSFDIGIKNLAFCKLEIPTGKIILWDNLSLIDTFKCSKCKNNASVKHKTEGTYFCDKHKTSQRVYTKLTTVKNCELSDLARKLYYVLESCENLVTNVTHVVIENQLTKNPKMKFIAAAVLMYFANKCEESTTVKFISAKYKLKNHLPQGVKMGGKQNYRLRKTLAIETTAEELNDNNLEWIEYFNNSGKKDDLSDSYLQGIYYLEKIIS